MDINPDTSRRYIIPVGKTGDDTWQPLKIDAITHALETVEYQHHEIHDKNSFTAYYARTTDATISHRSGLYIKTPLATANGKLIHMVFSGACSVAADFSINEAPTLTSNAGSGAGVIYNRYRSSTKTSGLFDNATSPAVNKFTTLDETAIAGGSWNAGTVLRTFPLAVGSGPKAAGGVERGTQEYILKPNTSYVIMLTNTGSPANDHLLQMDWYEEVPKGA